MPDAKPAKIAPLGIVVSPRAAEHRPPDGSPHPERPERMTAVLEAIASIDHLALHEPTPADDETLLLVHPPHHLEAIAKHSAHGGRIDADTYVSVDGDAIARAGVGACLAAADAVVDGRCRRAFVATRPPGHHAEPDRAMGFCLYANAAIAVRHLQRRRGLGQIAVVDFDVHHGNGTQAVFRDDPSVLTISVHQDPRTLWPGTGFAGEPGEAVLNVPLPPGTGDGAWLAALEAAVVPAVERHRPEVLVVCAGFDAHADDPLANLALTSAGFGEIGTRLARLADDLCDGRLLATLEGGYDLNALRDSTAAFLTALREA